MGDGERFAETVVTAEQALEELIEAARKQPHHAVPGLLRQAFTLGRAEELRRAAHHAARALEELAEDGADPDAPSRVPWSGDGFREPPACAF